MEVCVNFFQQSRWYCYLAPFPLILLYRYLTKRSASQIISQQFNNHNILITGAGGDFGRSFSLRLAKTNSTLFLTDLNEDALEQIARECRDLGSKVFTFKADLSKKEECKNVTDFVSTTLEKEQHNTPPRLDFLLLNHGIAQVCDFKNITDISVFQKVIDINFVSNVILMHYLLPLLHVSEHPKVLVMSSLSGKLAVPRGASYASSKHALQGFFNTLRIELPHIRFTISNPVFVPTNIFRNSLDRNGVPYKERYLNGTNVPTTPGLFGYLSTLPSADYATEKNFRRVCTRKKGHHFTFSFQTHCISRPIVPLSFRLHRSKRIAEFFAFPRKLNATNSQYLTYALSERAIELVIRDLKARGYD